MPKLITRKNDVDDLNWIIYHSIGTLVFDHYFKINGCTIEYTGDPDVFKLFLGWYISLYLI
jgi:hypothetical protein